MFTRNVHRGKGPIDGGQGGRGIIWEGASDCLLPRVLLCLPHVPHFCTLCLNLQGIPTTPAWTACQLNLAQTTSATTVAARRLLQAYTQVRGARICFCLKVKASAYSLCNLVQLLSAALA